jgi:hypothetical protein
MFVYNNQQQNPQLYIVPMGAYPPYSLPNQPVYYPQQYPSPYGAATWGAYPPPNQPVYYPIAYQPQQHPQVYGTVAYPSYPPTNQPVAYQPPLQQVSRALITAIDAPPYVPSSTPAMVEKTHETALPIMKEAANMPESCEDLIDLDEYLVPDTEPTAESIARSKLYAEIAALDEQNAAEAKKAEVEKHNRNLILDLTVPGSKKPQRAFLSATGSLQVKSMGLSIQYCHDASKKQGSIKTLDSKFFAKIRTLAYTEELICDNLLPTDAEQQAARIAERKGNLVAVEKAIKPYLIRTGDLHASKKMALLLSCFQYIAANSHELKKCTFIFDTDEIRKHKIYAAWKLYKTSRTTSKQALEINSKQYERAHISLINKIVFKILESNVHVRISKGTIGVKWYDVSKKKNIATIISLSKALNSVHLSPQHFNQIDMLAEGIFRPLLYKKFEEIREGMITPEAAIKEIKQQYLELLELLQTIFEGDGTQSDPSKYGGQLCRYWEKNPHCNDEIKDEFMGILTTLSEFKVRSEALSCVQGLMIGAKRTLPQ